MKTIDVREGDTWTIGPDRGVWIYQYRGGQWRGISPDVVESYWCSQAKLDGEVDLSKTVALAILRGYGYHLTPGEGENPVVCSKCRTFGCDHHTLPAAKPEANSKCQQESKPETLTQPKPLTFMDDLVERTEKAADMPRDEHSRPKYASSSDRPRVVTQHRPIQNVMVTAAEAKPADVPEVDVVWVEDTMADGSKSLTAYSGRESAESCAKLDMERGRARIVRIRNDDEKARFLANHANERLDRHVDRLAQAHARIDALESRLAAEKADRPLWVNRYDAPTAEEIQAAVDLAKQLRAERDKPAARVVKAPKFAPSRVFSISEQTIIHELNRKWREVLNPLGIKVEAAE